MGARALNALLGLWLFVSAFLWPHSRFQLDNAWITGIAAVVLAMAALSGVEWARYLNAALGAWLIVSAILARGSGAATRWNHLIVGFLVAFIALAPNLPALRRRRAVGA
jgi:hypothetical protein